MIISEQWFGQSSLAARKAIRYYEVYDCQCSFVLWKMPSNTPGILYLDLNLFILVIQVSYHWNNNE